MATETLDIENIAVIALALLAFFWFNKNKVSVVVGSGAGNPAGKKGGCGCGSLDAPPAVVGQPTSTSSGRQRLRGSPTSTSNLVGPTPVLAGGAAPKPAPGSNRSGSGSGGNYPALNRHSSGGTTPRNTPGSPISPTSSRMFTGHTTVSRYKQ